MTEDILIPKLKDRFTNWPTPIKWPNEVFQRKDGHEYIRVEIFPSTGTFSGIGTTNTTSEGFIRVTVFVPVFTGTVRASELAKQAEDLLKSYSNGGLQCYAGYSYTGPKQPVWFQMNTDVKYKFNQCYEV